MRLVDQTKEIIATLVTVCRKLFLAAQDRKGWTTTIWSIVIWSQWKKQLSAWCFFWPITNYSSSAAIFASTAHVDFKNLV